MPEYEVFVTTVNGKMAEPVKVKASDEVEAKGRGEARASDNEGWELARIDTDRTEVRRV